MGRHQFTFADKVFLKHLEKVEKANKTSIKNLNFVLNNDSFKSYNLADMSKKALDKASAKSVLLSYSQFIKNKSFNRFCRKFWLEKAKFKLNEHSKSQNRSILIDEDIFKDTNEDHLRVNIYFDDQEQINYATYLCMLNDHVVQPWLASKPNANATNFSRFFSAYYFHGKSFHDTRHILTVATHAPFVAYNKSSLFTARNTYCLQCGFTGHFREKQQFHGRPNFNVTNIFFDSMFFLITSSFKDFNK